MHVLFADTVHSSLSEKLRSKGCLVVDGCHYSREDCADFFQSKVGGIIIRGRFNIDKTWIDLAKGLQFIARFGSGMEHIDVAYATQKGVKCFSSAEGNKDALGDHALGMLLMLLNKLHIVNNEVREGKWEREGNRGVELNSLTLGIIGYGNMGSSFAKRLLGFDCQVLVYDPYKHITQFPSGKYSQVPLEILFEKADVISVHVPLNTETKGMIDSDFFASCKSKIIVINTSRGPVLRTSDLLVAMDQGKVIGACLDVLDFEEENFESINALKKNDVWQNLIRRSNVILSPHIAGWSVQSNKKMADILFEKISNSGIII